jgi:hypothetical protein
MVELGSISTEECKEAHSNDEGKVHITYILHTNWNNSKTFKKFTI